MNASGDGVMDVRRRLMLDDPNEKKSAVEWILNGLENDTSIADRDRLIDQLIETGTVYVLCENISCSYGPLFNSMLDIIDIVRKGRNFYKHKHGKNAIDAILRPASGMLARPEVHQASFCRILQTFYLLLDGGTKAGVPIADICYPRKMVAWIEKLKVTSSPNHLVKIGAAKNLGVIMRNIRLDNDDNAVTSLWNAFDDCLESLCEIIAATEDSDHPEFWNVAFQTILSTCRVGTRFCNGSKGEQFAASIIASTIEFSIPHLKKTEIESTAYEINLTNFVECLEVILQFENRDHELAEALATNGYLTYLMINSPLSLEKSVSSVVTQVIFWLSEADGSSGNFPETSLQFRKYLNEGFSELFSQYWESLKNFTIRQSDISAIVATGGAVSDALVLLLHHHCCRTYEDGVSLAAIVQKVLHLSGIQLIPVLKATWFCFAESWQNNMSDNARILECTFETSDGTFSYTAAAKHLAVLLQTHDLRKCFTQDQRIVEHGLNCVHFPVELRHEIVRLWLEFDGDIKPFLAHKNSEILPECLVTIVAESSGNLVNTAAKIIDELICDEKQSVAIRIQVWKRLPKVLNSCSVDTAANVKALIKFVSKTQPDGSLKNIAESLVATLSRVLTDEALDDELKAELLKYVNLLLQGSKTRDSSSLVEFCVRDLQLLTKLRDKGFARENFQLSAFCVQLVADILENQRHFEVQRADRQPVRIEPLRMLVLLARSNRDLANAAIQLLIILLTEKAADLSLTLNEFESGEQAHKSVHAWYRVLHQILPQRQREDWRLILEGLISVIRFCERKRFTKILNELLNYRGTCELIRWIIEHNYNDLMILHFAKLWVQLGTEYRPSMMVQTNLCERFPHFCLCDTEFKETLELLNQFLEQFCDSAENP